MSNTSGKWQSGNSPESIAAETVEAEAGAVAQDFRHILRQLSDQIAETDAQHAKSLQEMESRLARLSEDTRAVSSSVSGPAADSFQRLQHGMFELAGRIHEAQGPQGIAGADDAEALWDHQSAEALAAVHHGAPERHGYAADKAEVPALAAALPQAYPREAAPLAALATQDPSDVVGRRWLDAKLAEIARDLEVALGRTASTEAVEDLSRRFDTFAGQMTEAISSTKVHVDLSRLDAMEAELSGLKAAFEATQSQIAKLGDIERVLDEMLERLSDERL